MWYPNRLPILTLFVDRGEYRELLVRVTSDKMFHKPLQLLSSWGSVTLRQNPLQRFHRITATQRRQAISLVTHLRSNYMGLPLCLETAGILISNGCPAGWRRAASRTSPIGWNTIAISGAEFRSFGRIEKSRRKMAVSTEKNNDAGKAAERESALTRAA